MEFSKRANSISPSVTVELNAKVAQMIRDGIDVVKMNIGEPDFDTPKHVKEAAKKAIDDGFTKYTPVPGIPELKKAISEKLLRDNHLAYRPDEICVSTGAKQAIMNALLAIAGEGDEVIIPIPCWVSYESMVEIAGAKSVTVPTKKDFRLDFQAIERAISKKTRAIIINTPNNPTGTVYGEEDLMRLAKLADRHDFYIISDEVYEKLTYNGARHISVASLSEAAWNHTVTVNGVSKSYAMTGWRIGYLAGPKELVKKASALQSHMTSASNSIAQKAALAAIAGPQDSVEEMRREFDRRRQVMYERLNRMDGVSCQDSCGAFYLMPDVSSFYGKKSDGKVLNHSVDLAEYLLEEAQIAVVPGAAFRAPDYLRLSYSNSMENLMRGLDRMEEALKKLR